MMRPDQRTRLADVAEKLAEVVIRDVDPDNWVAPDKTLVDMTQQERGDAKWCRQTAAQSVALLVRMEQLLEPDKPEHPNDPDPEAEIKRAEKAATKALDTVMRRTESAN
jgi:hypothetical protein